MPGLFDERAIDLEEDRLRNAIGRLPADRRKEFYDRTRGRIKDPDTYAVLNWFFLAGLHHFYLGETGRGAAALCVFLVGLGLLFTPAILTGLLLILGVLAFELPQLVRAQLIVRRHNNRVTETVLREMGESP